MEHQSDLTTSVESNPGEPVGSLAARFECFTSTIHVALRAIGKMEKYGGVTYILAEKY